MGVPAGIFTGKTARTYATWNPADKAAGVTLSGGNLTATITAIGAALVRSTVGKSSGKWYWEITIGDLALVGQDAPGIAYASVSVNQYSGQNTSSWGINDNPTGGGYLFNGGFVGSGYLAYTTGDVLGFALDMDGQTLAMTKNNVAMGSGISGLSDGSVFATASIGSTSGVFTANFGASPFAGTVPAGYNGGLF